jgi:catechol 2,3-dioxygenase
MRTHVLYPNVCSCQTRFRGQTKKLERASNCYAVVVLPAATRLGPVELTVTSIDRSLPFYLDVIGLGLRERHDGRAALGSAGEDVLVLAENPGARPQGRHAGLYHVALRFPTRVELARVAARLAKTRTRIQGASDHGTHEAIYLPDPDDIGLELAADRPRDEWPSKDMSVAGPQPLDTGSLLALADGDPGDTLVEGVAVGHVHLHVGDLEDAMRFYRDTVGFETQATLPTAGFVSAGGYHHHVAFNVWRGEGIPPAPDDAVGMRHFTLYLPEQSDVGALRERVRDTRDVDGGVLARDPSGNAMLVAADPGA